MADDRGRTSQSGRTISDADRRLLSKRMLGESGRTISDADRRLLSKRMLGESGRTISDADRARILEAYINRNDGGIAKKTRNF
jgi:hypothetical protein